MIMNISFHFASPSSQKFCSEGNERICLKFKHLSSDFNHGAIIWKMALIFFADLICYRHVFTWKRQNSLNSLNVVAIVYIAKWALSVGESDSKTSLQWGPLNCSKFSKIFSRFYLHKDHSFCTKKILFFTKRILFAQRDIT